MEGVIQTQYQIMEAMQKLLINFKKDGESRKTPSSVQKKIDLLDKYWAEFQINHEKIRGHEDSSHQYFMQESYEQTKKFYRSTRESFIRYLHQEEKPASPALKQSAFEFELAPSPSQSTVPKVLQEQGAGETGQGDQPTLSIKVPEIAETTNNSRTDEMLRKQRSNIKAFQRTASNINVDLLKENWQFEDALKELESRWKAVDSLYWEIDSLPNEANVQYEMSYNTCELVYNQMKATINSKMWSVTHRERSTPIIKIPTFSGSYEHWTGFKDLFVETIHSNPSLSNAQRMQFLKSKVKGEAEKLIQHLSISSENYGTAWEILNRRYNNRKLIFTSHLNSLLAVPSTQHLSAGSVKKLHDTTKECINAIKNLGVDTSSWDPILVHLLSQKLDTVTHNDYLESLVEPRELPNLAEFLDFLEGKFTSWESSRRKPETAKPSQSESAQNNKKFHSYKAFNANQNKNNKYRSNSPTKDNANTTNCPHCNQHHKLFLCKTFLELHPVAKRQAVSKYNLCINCLNAHTSKECPSRKTCRVCNSDHNTLLHDAYGKWIGQKSNSKSVQETTATTDNKKTTSDSSNHVSQEDITETLLTTALIKVQAYDGSLITLRALLDQGSQTSLITEKAAQKLRLPRGRCKGVIFGVGAKENNCKGVIRITCSAIHGNYTFDTDVFIMRNLINNLPNKSFKIPKPWTFIQNIPLADPDFHESRPVDILLGAEIYSNIIQEGIIRHNKSQPVAQQTRLGWILCGNVQATFQCNVVMNDIESIQKFWTVEDITENSGMSQDDLDCLQHYKNTTTRDEEGRYIVELPFEPNFQEKLGATKPMALAQFRQLEKKFCKQPQLAEAYRQFIQEYQALNHMVECTSNVTPACYLPHHCVQRADSTTTALRVVFNASAKTSTGHTLNELMKRGPNLQQDLMSLILRWRQYQFAYTADIEKMYRQIRCSNDHQAYQKILWRSCLNQRLREYQLTTVTYGMKAAPFLAMMTMKQLASDEGHKYQHSRAAQALQEEFYMDDLVSGSFTLSSAKQLQGDLIRLLRSGGFNLRKWSANNEELLQNVSRASSSQASFDFKQAESTKTLGLKWNPNEDTFSFELKICKTEPTEQHTKRSLLSHISKIFDPLGWLAPVTTTLKLLFKQVWLSNIQWDDQLPMEISTEWEQIKTELLNINQFRIQRWYQIEEQDTIQLHGFCDASVKAYACVVYCKIGTKISLVAAKTRLVPENKKLTLPRLELSGAHLLTTLMRKIQQALNGRKFEVFGWCDSTAVLGWIHGNINRWTPFVANRVKQIKDVIPSDNWHYVKSAENPADCASRGITTEQLKQHNLWWSGPQFLPGFEESTIAEKCIYVTDQEERKSKQSNVTIRQPHSDDVIQFILQRHSNLTRAVRVFAWVLRITRRHNEHTAYLNGSELEAARHRIIKYVQESEFSEDINMLRRQEQVHKKSKTLCLNPFLDIPAGRWALGRVTELHPGTDGLVRVVTLKTKNGHLKRPVIKLSVLVSESNEKKGQISDSQNIKTKDNQSKQRPGMASNLIATLVTLFLFMTSVFGNEQLANPYTLTTIHKALYFDRISNMQFIRDEWKLIVYYDMNPYWDGSATFDKYIKQINSVCERETNKVLCDIILQQLRHSHDELAYYNVMLLNQHFEERIRRRRGLIDGVGYAANSLFGVLDQRFADQYKQDISLIQENENHLALLWKNQTSVVEAEYNLLKRTEESINRQHKAINQHLNILTKGTNTLNKNLQEQEVRNELALSTIIATNMLTKLKSIQDTIIDTITDVHHGMFSAHLLSPKQLRVQLSIISGQLSRELSLPIENIQTELPKIYHLLKVKTRITHEYLIFEIRIPLVNRESYDVYKLISIPQQYGNSTIAVVPISDYIAINLRKDTYLSMTARDIQQCLEYDESSRLCHSRKPIFQFKSEDSMCIKDVDTNRCLTNTAACRNNWTELNKINTYLYYCCEQCALRVICGDYITAIQITKAGVIALDSDCVIKGQDFTVYSHKLGRSEIKTTVDWGLQQIAPINHIINVTLPQVELNITDHKTSLRHIKEQIEQMKSEQALNLGISSHDIHQYSAIYVIWLGAVLVAVIYTCRWFWRRHRQRSTNLQSYSETQPPVPQTQRQHSAPSVGPTPRTKDSKQPQEAVELRNFSSLLSSIKRHKRTPTVVTPVSGDSD